MKEIVERELLIHFRKKFGSKDDLSKAIFYALTGNAKRIRPLIIHKISEDIGGMSVIYPSLVSEYFHTSSIIVDDLPCMDNANSRRLKRSLHKEYGERTSLLASYALIGEGLICITESGKQMALKRPEMAVEVVKVTSMSFELASKSLSLEGAVRGQHLDFCGKRDLESLKKVIFLKTAISFESTFAMGWGFAGGSLDKLEDVKKLGLHFGIAFQLADDIKDVEEDYESGRITIPTEFGTNRGKTILLQELEKAEILCKKLSLDLLNFLKNLQDC